MCYDLLEYKQIYLNMCISLKKILTINFAMRHFWKQTKSYVIPQWGVMDFIFKITAQFFHTHTQSMCLFVLRGQDMVSLKLISTTLLSLKQSETDLWLCFSSQKMLFVSYFECCLLKLIQPSQLQSNRGYLMDFHSFVLFLLKQVDIQNSAWPWKIKLLELNYLKTVFV